MSMLFSKVVAGGMACLGLVSMAWGQEAELEESEFESNFAGFFVGVTGEDRRDRGLTLGGVYERRFSEHFGVGAEIERVLGDLDFWVGVVPIAYHAGPWKFYAGPGVERQDKGETENLLRVGLEYAFEFDGWEASPTFDVDFVDGDTVLIGGVLFGFGF